MLQRLQVCQEQLWSLEFTAVHFRCVLFPLSYSLSAYEVSNFNHGISVTIIIVWFNTFYILHCILHIATAAVDWTARLHLPPTTHKL